MKVHRLAITFLMMTIMLWSSATAAKSRYCSMHLPRALIAICGVTKRGSPYLTVDSAHAFLTTRRYFRRSPSEQSRYRRAVETYWRLHNDITKRGLAPIHVMADICCRRGCSLDDLLETCQ